MTWCCLYSLWVLCVGSVLRLPPFKFERAGDLLLSYSNTSLGALNSWYALLRDSLPLTFSHIASCIHWCRRGRSMSTVNYMYPLKGRSNNWILSLVLIPTMLHGHWRIQQRNMGMCYVCIMSDNPVEVPTYLFGRRQHTSKVPRLISSTFIQ